MSTKLPAGARLATAVLTVVIVLVSTCAVEAGPQWRLRRWSSSPPINPTIRSTVAFGTPGAKASYNRSRYNNSGYRVRYR